jgi:hypothetical protein
MTAITHSKSTEYPLKLRNRIHDFKMKMKACSHAGLHIQPDDMDQFLAELDAFEDMANEMGNELKHHRQGYQFASVHEAQEQEKAVLEAANDSKSNLLFFPNCARPIGDGI